MLERYLFASERNGKARLPRAVMDLVVALRWIASYHHRYIDDYAPSGTVFWNHTVPGQVTLWLRQSAPVRPWSHTKTSVTWRNMGTVHYSPKGAITGSTICNNPVSGVTMPYGGLEFMIRELAECEGMRVDVLTHMIFVSAIGGETLSIERHVHGGIVDLNPTVAY